MADDALGENVRAWCTENIHVFTDLSASGLGLEDALAGATEAARTHGLRSAELNGAFDVIVREGERHLRVVEAASTIAPIPDAEADRLFTTAVQGHAAWARGSVKSARRRGVAALDAAARSLRRANDAGVGLFQRIHEVWPADAPVPPPEPGINPTGAWALEHLEAFESLDSAVCQMRLEAGAAGDAIRETGSLDASAPALDAAREAVALAVDRVRECAPPPDRRSAELLAQMIEALDAFTHPADCDGWIQSWVRAMDLWVAFTRAFGIANGQWPSPTAES